MTPVHNSIPSVSKAVDIEPMSVPMARKYQESINLLILRRLRAMLAVGCVIYSSAAVLDYATYPALVPLFLKLRLLGCLGLLLILGLSYVPQLRRFAVWLSDAAVLDLAFGIIFMIYLADGSQSRYYEGLNLALVGLLVINSYHFLHNLGTSLVILAAYTLAVALNAEPFEGTRFFFAIFFMVSNAALALVMTHFYSLQYRQTFLSNEKLGDLFDQADTLSKIDDLTQVFNRRHFMQLLAEKLRRSRENKTTFFLVFIDIDHFKGINDAYGHAFGDQVIRAVVHGVRENVRATSHIGRYGGDEFVLFMDHPDKESFMERMRILQSALKNIQLVHHQTRVPVSVSFGAVRVAPDKYHDVAAITEVADRALLQVKRTGRGEIHLIE